MKAVRFRAKSVPFVLALITIAAYGLLLPLTGFYWDDWPFAWIARFLGPREYIPAFQGFRPFLGPIFFLTTSLLPTNPLVWQIVALLVRFISGLAVWFVLQQVWPNRQRFTLAATMLFLVFPGYSQHWVAFTHINQEWISLIAYLLSVALSIRILREQRQRIATTAGALLLQCIGLFPTEYFIGLELLRGLFIWVVVGKSVQGFGASLRAVIRAWWPYLCVWLINGAWLANFYWSGAYVSYEVSAAAAVPSALEVIQIFADALWKAGVYVWIQLVPLSLHALSAPTTMLTFVLMAGGFALLAFYLLRLDAQPSLDASRGDRGRTRPQSAEQTDRKKLAGFAVLIGIVGILAGRIPSFVAGLPLTLQSSFDRLTISMMLGASLLVAGLLELLISNARGRAFAAAALVALGIGQQFFNANIFRRDWQRQQEIYWQLAWRIPALKPHTALLAQQMPLDYETDLAMTAALNWMYAAHPEPPDLPYALIYTEKRLGGDALPSLTAGVPILLRLRTMEFHGSTSQVIVIYVPPSGCLRVFDPAFGDSETYSRFPDSLTSAIPLSDPSLITDPAETRVLPNPPFGREPTHGWCYFYEQAELARGTRDWQRVIALRQAADARGLAADDAFEWLPFIEAEARVGNVSWADQMTRESISREPRLLRGLCALWKRVETGHAENPATAGTDTLAALDCGE